MLTVSCRNVLHGGRKCLYIAMTKIDTRVQTADKSDHSRLPYDSTDECRLLALCRNLLHNLKKTIYILTAKLCTLAAALMGAAMIQSKQQHNNVATT